MSEEDGFVRITLRIPKAVHEQLTAAAGGKKSMNAEIIDRLEKYEKLAIELESRVNELFELRKQGWDRARGIGIDSVELPGGLSARIEKAATEHQRSKFEEIVQALEASFPLRPTVFEFIRDVIEPIGRETDPAKIKELADKANAIAAENGWSIKVDSPNPEQPE